MTSAARHGGSGTEACSCGIFFFYSVAMTRCFTMSVFRDLPVPFAIDRAGLVGSDGETHQGF